MSDTVGDTALAASDIVVIVIYFAFILFVGLWTSQSNRGSVGGYFLAGRNMNWVPLGASLFASNVGSLHFVGLAGSGAEAGIGIAIYELNAIFILIMLGWLFVPVYIASGVFTMPEYIKKRFGGDRIRMYLAVLSLILYIFTKISADLYAGALFIGQALGWNIYTSIVLLLLIASIFTITGGLTAVMWTDFIQTIIMVVGAIGLMALGFVEVGGMNGLRYKYERAVPNTTFLGNDTCGYPRDDYFSLIRDAQSGDIPWPGIIGITINSIWYWCADQVIVQRTLAGKTYSHAKGGTILAGYLKTLPLFMLVIPGMMARVLYTDEIACVDPDVCTEVCGSPAGCSDIAYPLLVLNLLPAGWRGVMLAVMLSALMSSLTSIFNSSSTIFTLDIWIKIRKHASDIELMIVGRLCVLVLMVVSILWIPIIQQSQGGQLFVYIQQVSSFLQPPICAVYLLAVFWTRANEQGAFWSLMVGLLIGGTRFILEFSFPPPFCYEGVPDDRPAMIKNFHYLYFAIFLFGVTGIVAIVVSLLTPAIDSVHLPRLTYQSRYSTEPRVDIDQEEEEEEEGKEGEEKGDKLTVEEYSALPFYRRGLYWVCGIDQQMQQQPISEIGAQYNTKEEKEEEDFKNQGPSIDISEEPFWQRFLFVQAMILMTVATLVCGFFAYSTFIVPLEYPTQ